MELSKYKKIIITGFGFFAISIAWSVYNTFVPKILNDYLSSTALIGFVMTIDNYFAIFLQPLIGNISDHTNNRFGRRKPYIIIGMPLAIIFLFLIPNYNNLLSLLCFLIFMNLSMSIFRSPVISLMPDITPQKDRSKANAIINLMGAIGTAIILMYGGILFDQNESYPFLLGGILMIVSFVILLVGINEKKDSVYFSVNEIDKDAKLIDLIKSIKHLDKKTIAIFLSICFIYMGYQGIESMFTLYGTEYLGLTVAETTRSFLMFAVAFVIFAIPIGKITDKKLGGKKAIQIGLIGFLVLFPIVALVKNVVIFRCLLIIGGFLWSFVIVNMYPLVVNMAPEGKNGTYTGFYYLFTSIAAIISPTLLGAFIDWLGYGVLFYYVTIVFLLAFIFITKKFND